MKALRLRGNEDVALEEVPAPEVLGAHEVLVRIKAVTLNHLDLYSYRGMAFAERKLPIVTAAEGVGQVVELGASVDPRWREKRVAIYSSYICGRCKNCVAGRENLCTDSAGILGFGRDGLAQEYAAIPERMLVEVPEGLPWEYAACAPITFSTVVHMLCDNARLGRDDTVLVHAGGSGIGTAAIKLAKHLGARVITTVGSDHKKQRAHDIGADHVVNYTSERFSRAVRKLTNKEGVDVVFEHIGPDTWNESMLSVKVGGRIVTCGSTTGTSTPMNLHQLFNKQIKIFGSFGASKANVAQSLALMSQHDVTPVIDCAVGLHDYREGLEKLRRRDVFGKIVVHLH
jgi:alcohol dehydrogenase